MFASFVREERLFATHVVESGQREDAKKAPKGPRVLNAQNHDPAKTIPLPELVRRIVSLAQVMAEKKFYPYQVELCKRISESVLLHDGEVVSCLMSRQAGKSEAVGAICASLAVCLPMMAKAFPDDWHLNITDELGNYRGFRTGLNIGIYAPKQEQAEITFERLRRCMETNSAKKILREIKLLAEINNGTEYSMSNGSAVGCHSASEQAKIEGATHHLLIAEEAQDIGDLKMRKSLHPMTAATKGTICKIGTASTKKCDFYTAIRENVRAELMVDGKRNHFFYPYQICQRYNSLYRDYIEGERRRIGEDSDEFRMSYGGEWIFERGMFISQQVLLNAEIALQGGPWSFHYVEGLPRNLSSYSIVAGIDWGSASDSTVVGLIAVDWNSPLDSGSYTDSDGTHSFTHYLKHVIGWIEFHGDNYETQFRELETLFPRIKNLKKITMDSNACGRPIYDRFCATYADRGIEIEPFNFSAKLKSDGYKALSGDFHAKRLTFPASPDVRKSIHYRKFVVQMLDLTKDYKNGVMVVAHPDERGAHDDYCDAVMLGAWGAGRKSVERMASVENGSFFN